jgi:trehalose 6-phosphate phosphatase
MNAYLLQPLSQRLASLAAQRHLLVCSDYDGTLAPLASRPEQAQLLAGAFHLLHDLARLPDTRVAIISGRSLDNLRTHSGLERPVLLVGSHGAELPECATNSWGMKVQAQLDALEVTLASICAVSSAAWIERKPLGIAVHTREATDRDAAYVLAQVRNSLANWPMMHVIEGKAVIELSLSRSNKGDAVRWLRDDWDTKPAVIYLGDDITDEAAFNALGPGDLGIKVGAGPTDAEYRIESEGVALDVLSFMWECRMSMAPNERPKA